MEFLKELLRILFPDKCVFCGEITQDGLGPCARCTEKLPLIAGEICCCCGLPPDVCACDGRAKSYQRRVAAAYYGGGIRHGVTLLKFRGIREAAKPLAKLMADTLALRYKDISFDCVAIVPMTPAKVRMRGYNQVELLGKELSKLTGIPLDPTLLKKVRENKIQHSLPALKRWENVQKTYTAANRAKDKTILLIDDIATTGATFDACAQALMEKQAQAVYCLAAAAVEGKFHPLPDNGEVLQ